MSLLRSSIVGLAVFFASFVASQAARGGLIEEAAFGLGFIGFDISGSKNPLNGGVDLLVGRNFIGNPLDFGVADLTLQGPLSLQASASRRGIPALNLSLTTAVNANSPASPLSYVFNTNAGGQRTAVSGTLLLDTDLSINKFGFYDLKVDVSSRQDIMQAGRFANGDAASDFDVGPIDVSGNIIADMLAMFTDPLFDRANVSNPFMRFSGDSSLSSLLNAQSDSQMNQLASGVDPSADDRAKTLAAAVLNGRLLGPSARAGEGGFDPNAPLGNASFIIPEPSVLILMMLGLPAVMGKRLIRRGRKRRVGPLASARRAGHA